MGNKFSGKIALKINAKTCLGYRFDYSNLTKPSNI